MKNILLISGLFLCLTGCTKKANIKLPEPENKLVVTCFISPEDSVITAVVRLAIPEYGSLSGTSPELVTNAKVSLSDGFKNISLIFDAAGLFYRSQKNEMPVVPGRTYQLSVIAGDKNASAATTVPGDLYTVELLKVALTKKENFSFDRAMSIVVPDIPGTTNYLALFFYDQVERADTTGSDYAEVASQYYFDSDEKTEKTKFFHSANNTYYAVDSIKSAELRVEVLNCSKDFYLYHKSVTSSGQINNPFADPVMVYTNVNNGFGCFGSYRATRTRAKIM